jgi:hypothetical protein
VLLYQMIERHLKYLLPHIVPLGSDSPAKGEGISNWRVFLDSSETLGLVMERLADRTKSSSPEVVADQLSKLVRYRNELGHHFYDQPFWRLETQSECDAALQFITARYSSALPLLEFLESACHEFVTQLRSVKSGFGTASGH